MCDNKKFTPWMKFINNFRGCFSIAAILEDIKEKGKINYFYSTEEWIECWVKKLEEERVKRLDVIVDEEDYDDKEWELKFQWLCHVY